MRASFAATLIACSIFPSMAMAQDVPGMTLEAPPANTISIVMGTSRAIRTERPYSSVQIIDPAIFDVVPESDHRLNIVPKAPGLTTLVIFDKDNKRMSEANVIVQRVPRVADTEIDDSFRGVPGRIKVHNDPKGLGGASIYSCTPNCDLIKEKSTAFEAPKPNPTYDVVESSRTDNDARNGRSSSRYERREVGR